MINIMSRYKAIKLYLFILIKMLILIKTFILGVMNVEEFCTTRTNERYINEHIVRLGLEHG